MSIEMGASDGDADDFLRHINGLSRQQLRDAYVAEATSHRAMLQRAKKDPTLKVAERWHTFGNFLRDMGPIPEKGWTLDRTNNLLREYGPDLCRWADPKTQSENRSNTRWVTLRGEKITAAELARRAGRPPSTVYAALDAGQSPEAIVDGPPSETYIPSTISDDRSLEAWQGRYRRWLKNEVHPEKRPFAPPEVYELIAASLDAAVADNMLTSRSFYELDSSEEAEWASLMQSDDGQARFVSAPARIEHALLSLTERNPKLAKRLTGPAGYHLLTFHLWREFLAARPASGIKPRDAPWRTGGES